MSGRRQEAFPGKLLEPVRPGGTKKSAIATSGPDGPTCSPGKARILVGWHIMKDRIVTGVLLAFMLGGIWVMLGYWI